MKDSIFYSIVRSFFSGLCWIIGLTIGLVILIAIIGGISESTSQGLEIPNRFNQEIIPNSKGERKKLANDSPVILHINIAGIIGTEKLNTKSFKQLLVESRENALKNNRVKAILLHINTPGGTVTDSDGIYHTLKWYKQQFNVPIYAYVDGLCASGGVYIACAADKIYSSHVSMVGSVGVLSPYFFNFTDLMNKIGVKSLNLSEGKGKDNMNPFRPWKEGETDSFKEIIKYVYDDFVKIVVENRPKISKDKLIDDYGANIFPATVAENYGFIDGSGYTYEDTLKMLAKEIDVEEDNYQVVELDSKKWLNTLLSNESPWISGKVQHELHLSPEIKPELMNKFLYLYQPG